MRILLQQVSCPHCEFSWNIAEEPRLRYGQLIKCRNTCGYFIAHERTVKSCTEDARGLVLAPLVLDAAALQTDIEDGAD